MYNPEVMNRWFIQMNSGIDFVIILVMSLLVLGTALVLHYLPTYHEICKFYEDHYDESFEDEYWLDKIVTILTWN